MKRPALTLAVAVSWSTLMAFCTAPSADCIDPTLLEHQSATGDAHELRYTLDWDASRITRDETGAWTTTTDLGYEVRVTQGYLVSLRSELVPCDETSALDTCAALLGILVGAPGRALAGHGDDEPDPSRLPIGQVESLTALEALTTEGLPLDGPAYCRAHYLVQQAFGFTRSLPDDVDMIGRSLYITGDFRAPDADLWQPFEASTTYANGALTSLIDADSGHVSFGHPGLGEVLVTITRELGALFDGIHIESVDPDELGDAILWNLVDHTTASVSAALEQ